MLPINTLVTTWLTIKLIILILVLYSFFDLFLSFQVLGCLASSFGSENRVYLFFKVFEKALKTNNISIFSINRLDNSLVCFWDLCKLGLSVSSCVVFGMIFDGKLPVGLFNLFCRGIIADLQNLVWVKLFLFLLWEVLTEELLLCFIF